MIGRHLVVIVLEGYDERAVDGGCLSGGMMLEVAMKCATHKEYVVSSDP